MKHRRTVLTVVVAVLTGVVAALAFVYPELQTALRRDPAALESGVWWRIVSPLLVRTDGWFTLATVLIGTLTAGSLVERDAGRWRWLVLYVTSGVLGQAFGYAWDPYGAGSSVAVLGLFAWIWYQAPRGRITRTAQVVGVAGLAALAAIAEADLSADSQASSCWIGTCRDWTGWALSRKLRAESDPWLREVPIVLMPAYASAEEMEQSFAAGVADYLTRPFTPAHLRTRARAWLLRGQVASSV
jgi:rhomboid protease GluP